MPRNASGAYSLPGGINPVVAATVITSNWGNSTLNDLANEVTNSLDRSGRGAMLAALKIVVGTAPAPGLAFSAEGTTGFYRPTTGQMAMSILGASVGIWKAQGYTGSILYTPAGGAAVERTVKSRLDEMVSLVDFGAVADDTTDCTAAMVSALAAAATLGQNLYIPPGTFKFTTNGGVTLPPKVCIIGAGREASRLHFTGTGYLFSKIIANHITTASWIDATYRDFEVSGSAAGTGAFYMEYTNFLKWDNLYIHGFTNVAGLAIRLKENYFYWISNCKFIDCAVAQVVLAAGATTGCNAGYIGPNNEFNGNNQTNCIALSVVGQGITIVGNDFEGAGNGNKAIDLDGCDGIHIYDNYIELWNGAAIAANSGLACSRIKIEANVINAASVTICPFNNGGAANSRISFLDNRFADATGLQTCVQFGTTTKVQTANNDPNLAVFSDLYGTDGRFLSCLTGSVVYDPPSIASGVTIATTVTVTGAVVGDLVVASHTAVGTNNVVFEGNVQAANTVRVIITNREAGAIDLVSGTLKVTVLRLGA